MRVVSVVLGLTLVSLLMAPADLEAQVVSYVFEGEPAFSLEYPPGWEVHTPLDPEKPLLSAVPRDGSLIWHGVWVVNASTRAEAEAKLRSLEGRLFSEVEFPIDPWTETYGDLEIQCVAGRGMYKADQRIGFFLGAFELPDGNVGAFVYMGDPDDIASHEEDLRAMLASLEVAR